MAMDKKAIEQKKRTLEAFAYIAAKNPLKNNMYNVLKVFYLADKFHMERYGRFIFNEEYAALDKGPVPSNAYDLMKVLKAKKAVLEGESVPVEVNGVAVVALREFDDQLFSDSELECLDDVITISRTKDLGDLSHDAAWRKARSEQRHFMPDDFIIDILANAESLKNLVKNRY
ncbi:hypothetical protein B7R56_15855 [Pseudomonas savastanoi pv. retacarpa]|uniref:Antitoxin SocA-like Panacea domain-containing protein n=2 Tax=Pseudomonas savastanoi TaxID=29438 RepID=A0ABC8B7U4_PSESS|nr:Panacea domain-containing protein [Pseudomonas savastanoi]ARD10142.1 hypothetical protein PSA3335_03050 [Pseudomonas savastanoi pv. savastanoi NCPPB 3335]KPY49693.1 membrane protein [Pseudomonas savastanoi pv. retacarpa]MBA4703740.1 SocA family protein [Pseudomonas savastanoi pv. savastanoi]OSR27459.1 hypothetical protein B7R56_15855 [Pseudomonas savastanoi pv. retacarpa]RML24671.1 hypothetical protein ALR00_00987 [Pseudomonas savastanoi pv. retacarpa]